MTTATIQLDDAKDALRRGAEYGQVWPLLAEADRDALAAWFVRTRGLPNLAARHGTQAGSGEGCPKCGCLMVRTGTCLTCQACGESSGGCS